MNKIVKTLELGGRTLTLTTGELAQQADGAVVAQMGETVVLATVASKPLAIELDYFPLGVEYQEKLYAGGRIKGSRWVKREGRPTDEEILTARLIDRSLRPLFPKTYKKEVQVIVTVLAVDMVNDPVSLGIIAAAAAVHISYLPWKGPVSSLNIGMKDGNFIVNPTNQELAKSKLDLNVSSTRDAILMIEAGAKEATEEEIIGGIEFAQSESVKVLDLLDEMAKEVGKTREVYVEKKPSVELEREVAKLVKDKMADLVKNMALHEGPSDEFMQLVEAVKENFEKPEDKKFVMEIIDHLKKDFIREMILKKGERPDGRKLDQVRELNATVPYLPRVHGSAFFTRGQTHVMSVVTLGNEKMGQLLESAEGEVEKNYMHQYNMPPYASGETGKFGNPGRREIGHGALAERALIPVIPSQEDFPYAIRVVSEVMSSNGSTSMASVCGSTLSLMDAGVPIKSPVAGIAMGLIIESEKEFAVLTDLMGIEDFNGDMDFKVAGTKDGITALQLDVKTLNLTAGILKEALAKAKAGREKIMKVITDAISAPRATVSKYAPKIKVVKIPVDKIGEFIGPGGKNVKKLSADLGVEFNTADDGSVSISGVDEDALAKAVSYLEGVAKVVVAGEIYEGEVVRLMSFGAFVNILPGKDGMVHVTDMGQEGFVNDASDVVKIGQKIQVRVKEVDDQGRINLSMNMDPSKDKPKESRPRSGGFSRGGDRGGDRPRFGSRPAFGGGRPAFGGGDRRSGGFSRGPRTGGFAPRTGGFRRDDRNSTDAGGPHFPASRLMGDDQSKATY